MHGGGLFCVVRSMLAAPQSAVAIQPISSTLMSTGSPHGNRSHPRPQPPHLHRARCRPHRPPVLRRLGRAREVYDSQGRNVSLSREKFVLLGGLWLAFMEGEPPAQRSYRHVAFAVANEDLPACEARLRALGAEVKPPRPRVEGEGQSLYFYDFDNHLFELHTGTLAQRLARYAQG